MNFLNTLLGISTAIAETATTTDPAMTEGVGGIVSLIVSMLPMVLIFVVFYFFMIRPQKKKDKQVKDMLAALKKGDRVCTIGGIYGTIMDIKDDTITLSVGRDNLSMVIARWAVRSVEDVTIENETQSLN